MTKNALARLIPVLLAGTLMPASLGASSGRDGLWHALEKENGSTLFYLVYSDNEVRAYTADWGRVNAKFDVSGDLIRFRIPVGTTFHDVEARFDGEGRLAGKYTRPHVQFVWNMEWTARHVSTDPDWEPWGFLKQARGGVIDLLGDVLRGGPFDSEGQFATFWEKEIDPRYYALLSATAYYDVKQPDFRKTRQGMLSSYYKSTQGNWAELKSFAEGFGPMQAEVVKDLKKLYPWLKLPGYLVPGLPLGNAEYDYTALPAKSVNAKRYLLLDAAWISSQLSPMQARYLTAQMLLILEHLSFHPRDASIRGEFLARGISALMASRLDYSEDPEDFLFQADLERDEREKAYRAFALELSKKFKEKAFRVQQDFFLSDHRSSSYLFAYDFARMLAKRFELRLLLQRFPYSRLRSEMVAYIKASKDVPEVAAAKDAVASSEAKN